ncbi:hypothetical protein C8R45DRAFT_934946 [Mycena sanguinolenta]|nr:hypothetical protein C8R45DRAFT_934946 [Mycena sanguinolenta]
MVSILELILNSVVFFPPHDPNSCTGECIHAVSNWNGFIQLSERTWIRSQGKKPISSFTINKLETRGAGWRKQGRKNCASSTISQRTVTVKVLPDVRRPRLVGASVAGFLLHLMHFLAESLYMELLAAEHNDEEPDDGEQDGSGDDFEG